MKLVVVRTDGKTGHYSQNDPRQERALVRKLAPSKIFSRGLITLGTANPFTVLNPDEICWIEMESTELAAPVTGKPIESARVIEDRAAFEAMLASKWMPWIAAAHGNRQALFEALVELSFRGGTSAYLHLLGRESDLPDPDALFAEPAIVATEGSCRIRYLNPKALVRARVYHSQMNPRLPQGLWFAEADEI